MDRLMRDQYNGTAVRNAFFSDERFQEFIEAAPDAIVLADEQGKIAFVNSLAEKMFGYTRRELIGDSIEKLIPMRHRGRHAAQRVAYTRKPRTRPIHEASDLVALRKDGTEFPVEISLGPIKTSLGIATLSTIRDITARRQAEDRRLLESEQMFRTLADAIPQLAWVAHANGDVFWFNRRWYEYTGFTETESVGWGWQNAYEPRERRVLSELWKNSLSAGKSFDRATRLRGRSGNGKWFLMSVIPIRSASGQVVRWFGASTDIDEQKRVEETLAESLRMRDEFLSIASHELKTPLSSLKLQAQMAQRRMRRNDPTVYLPERVRLMVEQIEKQVDRLNRLVDDMLDIARIRAGRLKIEPEYLDLCEVAEDVIEKLRPAMLQAGTVPTLERSSRAWGFLDRIRMEQVLTNLLTNAMRYGAAKPVHVRVEKREDSFILSVRDQGIGIPPEAQSRIFNRFERAISASEVSGMGLGLYICQEIVNAHGGQIRVESASGKGSVFFVELPIWGAQCMLEPRTGTK